MSELIKKPFITEKNNLLAQHRTLVFKVDRKATKLDIKEHVERYFKVKVESINTSVGRGKIKRTRKGVSQPKYYKKAFVKLKEGEQISIFEGN